MTPRRRRPQPDIGLSEAAAPGTLGRHPGQPSVLDREPALAVLAVSTRASVVKEDPLHVVDARQDLTKVVGVLRPLDVGVICVPTTESIGEAAR